MSTELLGFVGIALWLMALAAWLRQKGAPGQTRSHVSRRARAWRSIP